MENIDWPELSKLAVTFILGLLSGGVLEYLRHVLSIRRDIDKAKRKLRITCEFIKWNDNWIMSGDPIKSNNGLLLTIAYDSQRAGKIAQYNLKLKNGIMVRPRNHHAMNENEDNSVIMQDGETIEYKFHMKEIINFLLENNSSIATAEIVLATGEDFNYASDEEIRKINELAKEMAS